jgi:hypothetical protein
MRFKQRAATAASSQVRAQLAGGEIPEMNVAKKGYVVQIDLQKIGSRVPERR